MFYNEKWIVTIINVFKSSVMDGRRVENESFIFVYCIIVK
jgi:hypothetical protein